jgi:hypothetical protein
MPRTRGRRGGPSRSTRSTRGITCAKSGFPRRLEEAWRATAQRLWVDEPAAAAAAAAAAGGGGPLEQAGPLVTLGSFGDALAAALPAAVAARARAAPHGVAGLYRRAAAAVAARAGGDGGGDESMPAWQAAFVEQCGRAHCAWAVRSAPAIAGGGAQAEPSAPLRRSRSGGGGGGGGGMGAPFGLTGVPTAQE